MEIAEIQPQLFAEFKRILARKKLSHAYLFSGGFGSFDLAIWLSQAIFCKQTVSGLPCGNCRTCRLVRNLEFADLHVVEPDGQTIRTAQIRALSEVFNESGYEGLQKVVVIRQAEKMHLNAANALLKSIEEPEGEVYVFLLSENENLILPTVKSRTQVIHFPKNTQYLQDFLEKNGSLKTQAELLSQICSSTNEALNLVQMSWLTDGLNQLQQFVKLLTDSSEDAVLYLTKLSETFDDKNKQRVAFDLILQLLYQKKLTKKLQKTFLALKMWQSNVRFESCLTYLVLEK